MENLESEKLSTKMKERTRQPLSCDRIVEKAIEIVDKYGVDELSMRKLGAELGVEAMSLYRYFPTKTALQEAVVEALNKVIVTPDPKQKDWRGQVKAYAFSIFHLAQAHPNAMPLFIASLTKDSKAREIFAGRTEIWRTIGFSQKGAVQAQLALRAYVLGTTVWEFKDPLIDHSQIQTHTEGSPLLKYAEQSVDWRDSERVFEFGLDLLLDGLEARLRRGQVEA